MERKVQTLLRILCANEQSRDQDVPGRYHFEGDMFLFAMKTKFSEAREFFTHRAKSVDERPQLLRFECILCSPSEAVRVDHDFE